MSDIVDRARRNAKVIYIAVAESVADEISGVFIDCANEIDRLRAVLAAAQAERDALREGIDHALNIEGYDDHERIRQIADWHRRAMKVVTVDAALAEARRVLRLVMYDTPCPSSSCHRCVATRAAVDAVLAQEEPS